MKTIFILVALCPTVENLENPSEPKRGSKLLATCYFLIRITYLRIGRVWEIMQNGKISIVPLEMKKIEISHEILVMELRHLTL